MGYRRGEGGGLAAGIMAASAQGLPSPLPPKETHRYRIALPGLTGQNSPTIGGEGKREGGRGRGGIFGPQPRDSLWRGPRDGACRRERERERSGASSLPSSRADPIN